MSFPHFGVNKRRERDREREGERKKEKGRKENETTARILSLGIFQHRTFFVLLSPSFTPVMHEKAIYRIPAIDPEFWQRQPFSLLRSDRQRFGHKPACL